MLTTLTGARRRVEAAESPLFAATPILLRHFVAG